MFIGQQDESSINFARPKGAKDKMPRKKSGLRTAAKVGAGLAGAAGIGAAGLAAVKNRKAIGGALNAGRAATMRSGYSAADRAKGAIGGASSAVQGGVRDLKASRKAKSDQLAASNAQRTSQVMEGLERNRYQNEMKATSQRIKNLRP